MMNDKFVICGKWFVLNVNLPVCLKVYSINYLRKGVCRLIKIPCHINFENFNAVTYF